MQYDWRRSIPYFQERLTQRPPDERNQIHCPQMEEESWDYRSANVNDMTGQFINSHAQVSMHPCNAFCDWRHDIFQVHLNVCEVESNLWLYFSKKGILLRSQIGLTKVQWGKACAASTTQLPILNNSHDISCNFTIRAEKAAHPRSQV